VAQVYDSTVSAPVVLRGAGDSREVLTDSS